MLEYSVCELTELEKLILFVYKDANNQTTKKLMKLQENNPTLENSRICPVKIFSYMCTAFLKFILNARVGKEQEVIKNRFFKFFDKVVL